MKPDNFKLCYVDDCWAWFTTLSLSQQWGDDWDDSPYEDNAGDPNSWDRKSPISWKLKRLAWHAWLETPATHSRNAPYSVENINSLVVPWLSNYSNPSVHIFAGATIEEFTSKIKLGKGVVYFPQ